MFNIITETIAIAADNTFVGTLIAGVMIAFFGIRIYETQKRFDIEFSRKEKIHDLAVNLLTHVSVAVQDYLGQISVHDGKNPHAKIAFNKIESISPGYISKDTSSRFGNYISSIVQGQNELITPLALDNKNKVKVEEIANAIPKLNFILSTTSLLSELPAESLEDLSEQVLEHSTKVGAILGDIIKE